MTYTLEEFAAREEAIVAAGRGLVGPSLAEQLAQQLALGSVEAQQWLESLSAIDSSRLLYEWDFWSRPKQRSPAGAWVVWLIMSGRGFGKNRTAAEWVRGRIERGEARSLALIGPDWKDVRRYIVGGNKGAGGSGLLDVFPPWEVTAADGTPLIEFKETKAEIHFHKYGAIAYLNTAEQKELRGANLDTIWADELCKWKYAEALWNNLEMTLRDPGAVAPQVVVTTTPTPMQLLKDLIMDPGTHVTHGETDENAGNVAQSWLERMERRYGGTRVGLQELKARILGNNPDALFHMPNIEANRVSDAPSLVTVGVGVDPAVSEKRRSDEHGIVAAGVDVHGEAYVLADVSAKMSPEAWTAAAVDLALAVGADFFAVERNKVGDLAKHAIAMELKSRGMLGKFEIREVYSIDDKAARASLVSPQYEKGRVHHVGRAQLVALEAEITQWNPKTGKSPNRLDGLVHVLIELMGLSIVDLAEPAEEAFRGFREANASFGAPRGYQPLSLGTRGRSTGGRVI